MGGNDCFLNCFQLTDVGAAQAIALGALLRNRYRELGLAEETTTVQSTNVPRTVETAAGVITGLFPGRPVDAPPFFFSTVAPEEEFITPNKRSCPRIAEIWEEAVADWKGVFCFYSVLISLFVITFPLLVILRSLFEL